MSNKFHAYLLNVEPSNLRFLTTDKTEVDDMISTCNGRPLEMEDKDHLILLTNK